MDNQEQFFQILLVLVGVISQLISSILDKSQLRRILTVIAGSTIVIAATWVGYRAFGQSNKLDSIQNEKNISEISISSLFPIISQSLDFEDGSLLPWNLSSLPTVVDSSINTDNSFVHTGNKSLKLTVSFSDDGDNNFIIFESIELADYEARALVSYVLIPSTSQSRGKIFYAKWNVGDYYIEAPAYLDNGKEAFESPEIYSDIYEIHPGEWTPIVIFSGVGYRDRNNVNQYLMWKKGIHSAILTIWCDKKYVGDIFIDDVQILRK